MSVSVTKADGVTVFTLTSDPQSSCPPLCQIFKGLCYSPVCCSVSERLRSVQRMSQSVLAALHIMAGLLNIGLGAVLLCSGGSSSYQMDETVFPLWMGALFVLFGIMCILSEKYPSPCLVIVNVILNLAGVAFAIAAIVLYCINLADMYVWMCEPDYYDYYSRHHTTTLSPSKDMEHQRCLEAKAIVKMLVISINVVLIVLSVLELCLTISSATLGIKALKTKDQNKSIHDAELCKPLLEEDTTE